MFSSENATKTIQAIVKLSDGTVLTGSFVIAMTSDLPRSLNGDGQFIEFEAMDGQRSFIAKSNITLATPSNIPKAKKLDAGIDSDGDFNPYRVLKIKPRSDISDVRTAYHSLAKMYHPDRFSNTELPDEMAKYAENMSRLINAAFQMLENQSNDTQQTASG